MQVQAANINDQPEFVLRLKPSPQVYRANSFPQVHRGKLFYVIGVPAGLVYILYQLGLEGLKTVKEGAIATGCELYDMAGSGVGEGRKLVAWAPQRLLEAVKPPLEMAEAFMTEALPLDVAMREAKKLDEAYEAGLKELRKPLRDLLLATGDEALSSVYSGGNEAYKLAIRAPKAVRQAAEVALEPALFFSQELLSYGESGVNEGIMLLVQLPKNARRAVTIPLSSFGSFLYELYSYLPPGTYQLIQLERFVQAIVLELIDRGLLQAWLKELFSSADAGLNELAKGAVLSKEISVELASVIIEAVRSCHREMASYGDAAMSEEEKCSQEAKRALMNGYEYFKEPAKAAIHELFQTLYAGANEAKKGCIALPQATLSATEFPRELLIGLALEFLGYLNSGLLESCKSVYALRKAIKEGTVIPRELIRSTCIEFMQYLMAGQNQGNIALNVLPTALLRATVIPLECVESVMLELLHSLQSGQSEMSKLGQMLTEDAPNSFQELVLDPLEDWWLPKKRLLVAWVTEAEQMIREAVREIQQRWFKKAT